MDVAKIKALVLDLCKQDRHSEVSPLLDQMTSPPHALQGLARAVMDLSVSKNHESIRALHRLSPESSRFRYILNLATAALYAQDGNIRGVDLEIRAAAKKVLENSLEPWSKQIQFPNLVIQQWAYIDTDLKLSDELKPFSPPESYAKQSAEQVIVVSVDSEYFKTFATDFVRSLNVFDQHTVCHFHLINPNTEALLLFESLSRESAIPLALTTEAGPSNALYYSCRRLTIAPHLMQKYRANLIIADIDTKFTELAARLEPLTNGYDGGAFENPGADPMLMVQCSLVYFKKTSVTEKLLRLMANYVELKYGEISDLWMLDQCALLVMTRRAMRADFGEVWGSLAPLKWLNLATVSGGPLESMQSQQRVSFSKKEGMRRSTQPTYCKIENYQISFADNLRPVFKRRFH